MTLQEYLESLNNYSRYYVEGVILSDDSDENNKRFQLCYKVADAIKNLNDVDAKILANILNIVPAEFADFILFLAKENEKISSKLDFAKDILVMRYHHRFKTAVDNGTVKKLFSMNKKDLKDYREFKCRIFNSHERIMIVEFLGINPLEVTGRYKGKDKMKIALNESRKMCENVYEKQDSFIKEYFEEMMNRVELAIQALIKNQDVNIDT